MVQRIGLGHIAGRLADIVPQVEARAGRGAVVLIVATVGMVSTTYVQFIKGSLLVLFSAIMTGMILVRGLTVDDRPESMQPQTILTKPDGSKIVNGLPLLEIASD